jgi:hypothetical protein
MRLPVLAVLALAACARPDLASAAPARSGPYTLDLVDEAGAVLPTFQHRGRTFVLGAPGQRYLVRVRNGSSRRIEVVVSVDGRDVRDGAPSDWDKRGYLVDPYGELRVDGYRLSEASVAAFRFSTVSRSYSARMGDARDVGVIGAAVFTERRPPEIAAAPLRREPRELADEPAPSPSGRSTTDSAPAPRAEAAPAPAPSAPGELAQKHKGGDRRPGLGTEFGEEHHSEVEWVRFERANARPDALVSLRYDDRPGLVALGIDVDGRRASSNDRWLRETSDPFRRNPGFAQPPAGWGR